MAIIGPQGSGKSTLFDLLCGLHELHVEDKSKLSEDEGRLSRLLEEMETRKKEKPPQTTKMHRSGDLHLIANPNMRVALIDLPGSLFFL